jgi:hypothetical protein
MNCVAALSFRWGGHQRLRGLSLHPYAPYGRFSLAILMSRR